ncbi:MAG: hypothetical protein M1814_001404 [Vezdaea aestivalis]|nr:MAG: hypothetical protein M1814_001404 [Vezdaea aestivalis]
MASQLDGSGSEDVSDFLLRIRELGDKRDREDEERNRRLEQEIIQGRIERQARRAERARSLSPTKDSPSTTPQPNSRSDHPSVHQKENSTSNTPSSSNQIEESVLRPDSSPTQRMDKPKPGDRPGEAEAHDTDGSERLSGVAQTKRSSMAWQQRSKPQSFDIKSAPLGNSSNAGSSADNSASTTPSQAQIAQSLSNKDPAWFRQTEDRGKGSAAYRKDAVEHTDDVAEHRTALPGISGNGSTGLEMGKRSPSPSARNSYRGSSSWMSANSANSSRSGSLAFDGKGAMPFPPSHRFEPPSSERESSIRRTDSTSSSRALAMSPSQGRISPDRLERPASPTKGLGGFVESAMMKRSDSVAKRLGNTSQGINRSGSIAGHYTRNSVSTMGGRSTTQTPQQTPSPEFPEPDASTPDKGEIIAKRTSRFADKDKENKIAGDGKKASGLGITATSDLGLQPGRPSRSSETGSKEPRLTPSHSPTRSLDTRRWSPGKSTWLETALKKDPDQPKPKFSAPQQPAWMAEISKAKAQRASVDLGRAVQATESKADKILEGSNFASSAKEDDDSKTSTPKKVHSPDISQDDQDQSASSVQGKKSPPVAPKPFGLLSSATPPPSGPSSTSAASKTDFRSALRPRPTSSDQDKASEPEFKSIFGNLKRTKTQNYVAPDELKSNILRGKAGLAVTGGPKKTQRVDEFKESILKQKEAMKAKGGKADDVKPSEERKSMPPPPVAKQPVSLRSISNGKETATVPSIEPLSQPKSSSKPAEEPETTREPIAVSKLASKLNPGLAGILARGPPSASSSNSKNDADLPTDPPSPGVATSGNGGPSLTHATKARARGPKRRPPKMEDSVPTTKLMLTEQSVPVEKVEPRPSATIKGPRSEPTKISLLKKLTDEPGRSTKSPPVEAPKPLDFRAQKPSLKEVEATKPSNEVIHPVEEIRSVEKTESAEPRATNKPTSASPAITEPSPRSPPKKFIPESPRPATAAKPVESVPQARSKTPIIDQKPSSPKSPKKATPEVQQSPSKPTPPTSPQPLLSFFTSVNKSPLQHDFDASSFLDGPAPSEPKRETIRKQIWTISGDGRTSPPLPASNEHILFDSLMYICTHTMRLESGKDLTETYLWVGHAVPTPAMEDARLFARKAAREYSSKLTVLSQGKEPSSFIQALGGIIVTRRGSPGSDSAYMLCGRKYADQMVFDEVPLHPAQLSSGFPFLLMTGRQTFLWKGKGSSAEELGCARLIGMDVGGSPEIEELPEGQESAAFLAALAAAGAPDIKIRASAGHWALKPRHPKYRARLFHFEERGRRITVNELHPFTQQDLLPTQIYLLDAFFELYILIGPASQARYPAFRAALDFAQEYGILAVSADDRPNVPVCTVVLEGAPRDLKAVFRRWDDEGAAVAGAAAGAVKKGLRVVSLSSALDSFGG